MSGERRSPASNARSPSSKSRLARRVSPEHDRRSQAMSDEFAMTQEWLAHMLGAHRPSETLALAALREGGLIESQRGRVRILAAAGLEAVACECWTRSARQYAELVEVATALIFVAGRGHLPRAASLTRLAGTRRARLRRALHLGPESLERWSGRRDLNPRPPVPQTGALPDCATPRLALAISTRDGVPSGRGCPPLPLWATVTGARAHRSSAHAAGARRLRAPGCCGGPRRPLLRNEWGSRSGPRTLAELGALHLRAATARRRLIATGRAGAPRHRDLTSATRHRTAVALALV